ncbi:MAG: AAA family ATPase [Azospirillum sp.]|nr:AAA family ATPase [Azospirillum sp.]
MERTAQVIAIASPKGGVGKTAIVVNLAVALAAADQAVLVVDLDPLATASRRLGCPPVAGEAGGTFDLLTSSGGTAAVIRQTLVPEVSLLSASTQLGELEDVLSSSADRTWRLKQRLAPLRPRYSLILLDCPPSLGLLTRNALSAADRVLVPATDDLAALEALRDTEQLVARIIAQSRQTPLDLAVLLVAADPLRGTDRRSAAAVRKAFGNRVFDTEFALFSAPSSAVQDRPPLLRGPQGAAGQAAIAVAAELIDRLTVAGALAAAPGSGRLTEGLQDRAARQSLYRSVMARRLMTWLTNPASPAYDHEIALGYQERLGYEARKRGAERSYGIHRTLWMALAALAAVAVLSPMAFLGATRLMPADWKAKVAMALMGTRTPWEAGMAILAGADPVAFRQWFGTPRMVQADRRELEACLALPTVDGQQRRCTLTLVPEPSAPPADHGQPRDGTQGSRDGH